MVDFGITKWHHHTSLKFDGMGFFQHLKSFFVIILVLNMWQIMCGYLIVVKVIAKIRFSCKCYTNG